MLHINLYVLFATRVNLFAFTLLNLRFFPLLYTSINYVLMPTIYNIVMELININARCVVYY